MTIPHRRRLPRAALVRLAWARAGRATWRTVAVYCSVSEAQAALLALPADCHARVLSGVAAALRVGALTRD